ncbi:hypothetical protein BDZ91DRAFT_723507 [Kalaharituber pfeilii]|nr:hypothetical protein BDZ91DRAFT_723507 [Kalaharituber pfeilii]
MSLVDYCICFTSRWWWWGFVGLVLVFVGSDLKTFCSFALFRALSLACLITTVFTDISVSLYVFSRCVFSVTVT